MSDCIQITSVCDGRVGPLEISSGAELKVWYRADRGLSIQFGPDSTIEDVNVALADLGADIRLKRVG